MDEEGARGSHNTPSRVCASIDSVAAGFTCVSSLTRAKWMDGIDGWIGEVYYDKEIMLMKILQRNCGRLISLDLGI